MRARDHVQGRGPGRGELPNFLRLGTFPSDTAREVLGWTGLFAERNDLGGDSYRISTHCSLLGRVGSEYRQILLQRCPADSDVLKESSYREWVDFAKGSSLVKFMLREFPEAYRARIAVLPPGGKIDWHIDTDTRVSCRVHVSLKNEDSLFEVKRRGEVESRRLEPLEICFTNTGWPHRVLNPSSEPRVNLIFGIDYERIASRF